MLPQHPPEAYYSEHRTGNQINSLLDRRVNKTTPNQILIYTRNLADAETNCVTYDKQNRGKDHNLKNSRPTQLLRSENEDTDSQQECDGNDENHFSSSIISIRTNSRVVRLTPPRACTVERLDRTQARVNLKTKHLRQGPVGPDDAFSVF